MNASELYRSCVFVYLYMSGMSEGVCLSVSVCIWLLVEYNMIFTVDLPALTISTTPETSLRNDHTIPIMKLFLGTVPVYLGDDDWLKERAPCIHSEHPCVIYYSDFGTPEKLAAYLNGIRQFYFDDYLTILLIIETDKFECRISP